MFINQPRLNGLSFPCSTTNILYGISLSDKNLSICGTNCDKCSSLSRYGTIIASLGFKVYPPNNLDTVDFFFSVVPPPNAFAISDAISEADA